MAVLKCKMCGGDIIAEPNATYGTCDSCGTTMTLPRLEDEMQANRFNRANHFRRQNEFDKAIDAYEKILADDNTNAEAHWGVVLSRYGIEYVVDPISHERIPTCNRVQNENILTDPDYQDALKYATDGYSRSLYEEEARKIAEIQKGILAISRQEEPYDVFICYKETSAAGTRTKDSALAQEIYYQLKNEGYNVFFSRITLEDKLGQAYEPYIFAALNSAKVMAVVGTSAENYNAPWVKNEWSRFLALMKKDRSKMLIPCYRDMDPYDLPEELSMLQAQDMSKIGFMQDLIRGIQKVVNAGNNTSIKAEPGNAAAAGGGNYTPLLKRADMYREDGDFENADIYYEKVLDLNPECAEAYWGKLLAEMQVKSEADYLEKVKKSVDDYFYKMLHLKECLFKKCTFDMREDQKERIKNLKSNQEYRQGDLDNIYNYQKNIPDVLATYNNSVEKDKPTWIFRSNPLYQKVLRFGNRDLIEATEKLEENALCTREKRLNESVELIEKLEEEVRQDYINFVDSEIEKLEKVIFERTNRRKEREEKEAAAKKKFKKMLPFIIGLAAVAIICTIVVTIIPIIESNKLYKEGLDNFESGNYTQAAGKFRDAGKLDEFRLLNQMFGESNVAKIDILNDIHAVGLKSDGTVVATGYNGNGECEVRDWRDIVAISASGHHTVGLKSDGTVVATGDNWFGECEVRDWRDIVAIYNGGQDTIGLKSNGTVVATGDNWFGECEVRDWRDIVAISAGIDHTVGLKSDGTVVATGDNEYGACEVSDWRDIVAISAGGSHIVGLKSNGKVVATGYNKYGRCEVSDWKDIVAISAGASHTVGLKSDGTVVATGDNDDGECEVSGWRDIVAIYASYHYTVGLKSDGTVVATGYNENGECEVRDWRDIVAISASYSHTVGLKSDGTIVATGGNGGIQSEISKWKDIKMPDWTLSKEK